MRLPVLTILLTVLAGSAAAADRPNIVFIMSDDHAAHAISAYGSRVNTTPNIDRLARGGRDDLSGRGGAPGRAA